MEELARSMQFEEAIKARDLKSAIENKLASGDTSSVEMAELLDKCQTMVS